MESYLIFGAWGACSYFGRTFVRTTDGGLFSAPSVSKAAAAPMGLFSLISLVSCIYQTLSALFPNSHGAPSPHISDVGKLEASCP